MKFDFQNTLKKLVEYYIPKNFPMYNTRINLHDYTFKGADVYLIPSYPGQYNKGEPPHPIQKGKKKEEE